jgi:hypothetical protein
MRRRDRLNGLLGFRNISDVVRLFEEEGFDEANNLEQRARQKESNMWLRMGDDQKGWDDRFSTGLPRYEGLPSKGLRVRRLSI